ncbi:hypothetical protein ACHAWF_005482 [Thalassiosira exigua]
MHDGVREGRGRCLYNNDTMYEGQWRRDREHGQGTLMSSDWRRVIYSGAWEKGKIHRHGSYKTTMTPRKGSRVGDTWANSVRTCAAAAAPTHCPTGASTREILGTTFPMATDRSVGRTGASTRARGETADVTAPGASWRAQTGSNTRGTGTTGPWREGAWRRIPGGRYTTGRGCRGSERDGGRSGSPTGRSTRAASRTIAWRARAR